MQKYGGPAPTSCPDILRKRDRNYFKKFGVRNPSQNPEVMSKIVRAKGKGRPRYILTIHGKVFEGLQGAEAECIDLLVKLGVDPNNIAVYKKGVNYTYQNKRRVYFPDLLVTTPSGKQWLIEVKSTYTAGISKAGGVTKDGHAHLPKLRAKFRGAISENLNIALAIPHKGKLFIHKGSIPSRATLLKSFTSWLTASLQSS